MQFDWFTFFAQIVNFLILVLLLRHFLYRPITRTMRARESEIAARFEEAELQSRQAQHEAELFRARRQEFEAARDSRYAELDAEIEARRRAMYLEARNEVEVMQGRWYSTVEHERTTFLRDLRERIGVLVFRLTNRSLADLADANLEEQVVAVFAERLRHLEGSDRGMVLESGARFEHEFVVRSAFDLDYAQRQRIVDAIQAMLARSESAAMLEGLDRPGGYGATGEIAVHFERDPGLICGVELQIHDHRIGWSLRDYLHALEDDLAQVIDFELAAI